MYVFVLCMCYDIVTFYNIQCMYVLIQLIVVFYHIWPCTKGNPKIRFTRVKKKIQKNVYTLYANFFPEKHNPFFDKVS